LKRRGRRAKFQAGKSLSRAQSDLIRLLSTKHLLPPKDTLHVAATLIGHETSLFPISNMILTVPTLIVALVGTMVVGGGIEGTVAYLVHSR
jgi:hypothetical protein